MLHELYGMVMLDCVVVDGWWTVGVWVLADAVLVRGGLGSCGQMVGGQVC